MERPRAIAISHPHVFTAMNEWSAALGDVPIHLHADLRPHVVHEGPNVRYWQGITLVRAGGHSAWWDRVLRHDARARLTASVERYVKAIAE